MRDQPPLKKVERALACLVVLSDDQKLLARSSIIASRDIAQSAVADIKPLDNSEAKRAGALDDAATHGTKLRADRAALPTPSDVAQAGERSSD